MESLTWLQLGGKWYYLTTDGSMATGWVQLGSEWYYLNADGSMATGWMQLGNDWYYLNANGVMAADTWVDGFIWKVTENGRFPVHGI